MNENIIARRALDCVFLFLSFLLSKFRFVNTSLEQATKILRLIYISYILEIWVEIIDSSNNYWDLKWIWFGLSHIDCILELVEIIFKS